MKWLRFICLKLAVACATSWLVVAAVSRMDFRNGDSPRHAIIWNHSLAIRPYGRYALVERITGVPKEAPFVDVINVTVPNNPYAKCGGGWYSSDPWVDILPYYRKPAFVLGLLLPPWRLKRKRGKAGFPVVQSEQVSHTEQARHEEPLLRAATIRLSSANKRGRYPT